MKNNYEKELDDFLRNLLTLEYSVSLQYYRDTYSKSIEEITEMYSVIKNKHENFLATDGASFSISVGQKPIVKNFLEQGGFVGEKKREEFEQLVKEANYDLVIKQIREIKITRIISVISLIIAFAAIIVSVCSLNI